MSTCSYVSIIFPACQSICHYLISVAYLCCGVNQVKLDIVVSTKSISFFNFALEGGFRPAAPPSPWVLQCTAGLGGNENSKAKQLYLEIC